MKKKLFTVVLATLLSAVVIAGCATLGKALGGEDIVATTPEFIVDGSGAVSIKVTDLPDDLVKDLPEELKNTEIVIVDKSALTGEDAPFVPIIASYDSWMEAIEDPQVSGGIYNTLMTGLLAFFPSLAAWEGLLALLFKRKRSHWLAVIKSLIPWGNGDSGDVSVAEATTNIAKAVGALHSSEASEAAYKAEGTSE